MLPEWSVFGIQVVDIHGEFVSNLVAGPWASAVIPLDEPLPYE